MKLINTILNIATAASGIWLVIRLLYTYNDPVSIGSLFILLICAKCCVEVLRHEHV